MLLPLLYHRIGHGKYANAPDLFADHLCYLADNYPIVLPGDPLPGGKTVLCLTFDDASYDFYTDVYPLLQKHRLRALLAVPVRYIQEKSTLPAAMRLEVPYSLAMQDDIFDTKAPFCTWEELREMVQSGLVEAASHSYWHKNLTFPFVDRNEEIVTSKQLLEEKLLQPVTSFVYPFGRWNAATQAEVRRHYPYSFRIGSAYNFSWGNGEMPLARVPADNLTSATAPLRWRNRARYFLKALFN